MMVLIAFLISDTLQLFRAGCIPIDGQVPRGQDGPGLLAESPSSRARSVYTTPIRELKDAG
jgi:hypothetical protein